MNSIRKTIFRLLFAAAIFCNAGVIIASSVAVDPLTFEYSISTNDNHTCTIDHDYDDDQIGQPRETSRVVDFKFQPVVTLIISHIQLVSLSVWQPPQIG